MLLWPIPGRRVALEMSKQASSITGLSVAYGVGTRRLARRLVAGVASWLQRVDRQSQLGHRSGGRASRGNHCQPHCLQVSKTRLVRRCLREDGPLIAASSDETYPEASLRPDGRLADGPMAAAERRDDPAGRGGDSDRDRKRLEKKKDA